MMKVKMIEKRQNGVCLFELQNDEIKVITSNRWLSLFYLCSTKDRDRKLWRCRSWISRCGRLS